MKLPPSHASNSGVIIHPKLLKTQFDSDAIQTFPMPSEVHSFPATCVYFTEREEECQAEEINAY